MLLLLLWAYIVSVRLAKNVHKIDMVKSLKSNEWFYSFFMVKFNCDVYERN